MPTIGINNHISPY